MAYQLIDTVGDGPHAALVQLDVRDPWLPLFLRCALASPPAVGLRFDYWEETFELTHCERSPGSIAHLSAVLWHAGRPTPPTVEN